jgi:hypothetical protein
MKQFYNEEETKYSKLLNDLKSLPQIKAPENFEFNLMTRIENKNFGDSKLPKEKFNLIKFLAPSATVVAMFILFILFYPRTEEIKNEIAKQPSVADTQTLIEKSIASQQIQKPQITKTEKKKTLASSNINGSLEVSNSSSANSKLKDFINSQRSVSVDDYLSGATVTNRNMQRGNVVKSGDDPIVDGFFVEKQTDKQFIEKYRAALDSLRKAQQKADSLRKALK